MAATRQEFKGVLNATNLKRIVVWICAISIISIFESASFMPHIISKINFISVIQSPVGKLKVGSTIISNGTLMWNMNEISPNGKVKEIPVKNWGHKYDDLRVWCCVPTLLDFEMMTVIEQTWGKYCDKLLFFVANDSQKHIEVVNITQKIFHGIDHTINNVVKLPVDHTGTNEVYEIFWKMRRFLHSHHRNDYDWMIKADTDAWFSTPNFKGFAQYFDPNLDWYFGDPEAHSWESHNVVFTAGGCYALSRGSINKLNRIYATEEFLHLEKNKRNRVCSVKRTHASDVYLGICLKSVGIFITNSLDTQYRTRWSPFRKDYDEKMGWGNWWYFKNRFKGQGMRKKCCAEHMIAFHMYKDKNLTQLFKKYSHLDKMYSEKSKNNWMNHAIPPKPITFLFNSSFANEIVDEYFNVKKLPRGQRIWKGIDNLWNYSSVSNTTRGSQNG